MNDSKAAVGDLAAWLTQIWDEQEKAAREWQAELEAEIVVPARLLGGIVDPWRELARIAADRQILALHKPYDHEGIGVLCNCCAGGAGAGPPWPCETVRLLAQPYADREGFRDEWRVTAFERWLADD